jgi:hypothetical protein
MLAPARPLFIIMEEEKDFYATNVVYQVKDNAYFDTDVTYTRVPNNRGWVDAKKFRPVCYDLVYLKYVNKTITGWWTGSTWQGLRVRSSEFPLFWSKKYEKENK